MALVRVKVRRNWLCLCLYIFILKVMEEELAALAELRMKEESATELSVTRLIFLNHF